MRADTSVGPVSAKFSDRSDNEDDENSKEDQSR
jgi:hypothetical protein